MYKEILRSIAGIEVFPVISLVLFVTVFTIALVRALRMDRGQVEHASRLPLERGATAESEVRS